MPTKKMRVEIFDGEGNKYTLTLEGQITRDKAIRLLDLVELLGGMSTSMHHESNSTTLSNVFSKYDKIRMIIQKNFPLSWFSSREVQLAYEQEFKEPISLSTVATYLSRMTSKGILIKTGASNRLKYRLAPAYPEASIKQVP